MKDVFEPTEAGRQAALARDEEARPPRLGVVDPRIAFSLAPMTTVNFSLYDDYKFSLGGIITDREFSQRVQKIIIQDSSPSIWCHIFPLVINTCQLLTLQSPIFTPHQPPLTFLGHETNHRFQCVFNISCSDVWRVCLEQASTEVNISKGGYFSRFVSHVISRIRKWL